MADVSRTGLQHIEKLGTSPRLYILLKIAKGLGVKLEDLLS
jgi:DNA-binding XRE family transcriptional regulator